MIKRDDIFCLDDLEFFKLKNTNQCFGDSKMYTNEDYIVLLDQKEHPVHELYKIGFVIKYEK